jgi:hypothetical protein
MELKTIAQKRHYLKENLEKLNIIISAILGVRVNLKLEEKQDFRKEIYFKVTDNHNFKSCCGIMANAFKEVTISNFNMFWREDSVIMEMDFHYEHIDGGSNCAKFALIEISGEDGFITVK